MLRAHFQRTVTKYKILATFFIVILDKDDRCSVLYWSYYIQGYPQGMRLQRRLYGINTICFLILRIACNCKFDFSLAKS